MYHNITVGLSSQQSSMSENDVKPKRVLFDMTNTDKFSISAPLKMTGKHYINIRYCGCDCFSCVQSFTLSLKSVIPINSIVFF